MGNLTLQMRMRNVFLLSFRRISFREDKISQGLNFAYCKFGISRAFYAALKMVQQKVGILAVLRLLNCIHFFINFFINLGEFSSEGNLFLIKWFLMKKVYQIEIYKNIVGEKYEQQH